MFTWKATTQNLQRPTYAQFSPSSNSQGPLACTGTMEDPTPSNTLDHDALAESITTAYAEDELAKKICEQIKTANQPDSWTEREGCLLFPKQKYVLNKGTLWLHTICNHHDHPT